MEKIIKVDTKIQFCDICENEVGELQITDKYDKHICASCYDYRFIDWATSEKSNYQKRGKYKFDFNKINKLVLDEMKRQVKSGIEKYD
jgi:hypothetical protein